MQSVFSTSPILSTIATVSSSVRDSRSLRLLLLAFLALLPCLHVSATTTRRVVTDTIWACPSSTAEEVFDAFFEEMQSNVNGLFKWAFKGTGETKTDTKRQGKDAIVLRYGQCERDLKKRTSHVPVTVIVLGSKFATVDIGSQLADSVVHVSRRMPDGKSVVVPEHRYRANLLYSGSLLQDGNIQFRVYPIDDHSCRVHLELNIELGRFMAMFLTEKRWNEVAAWRIRRISTNLQRRAEGKATTK